MGVALLGIDPGLHGGLALIVDTGMPMLVKTPIIIGARSGKTKAGRPDYDLPGMLRTLDAILAQLPGQEHEWSKLAILEAVSTRPGQNAAATLTTGRGYGLWEMALTARNIPYVIAQPMTWKRHAGLLKKPKNAVRIIAQQLWPADDWSQHGDGPLDAAVMAEMYRTRMRVVDSAPSGALP